MGALNFGVLDALDIIIAAFLLYQIYRLLKGTAAIRILLGMVAIYSYTAWPNCSKCVC